ncbi:hypothetical protein [Aquincola tertiaricarbonis]|uniref:hypothetical protein n=1 Tax=Aquincola tertiaricarbonis TaxID=391953 RepID=UPI0012ED36A6|nr:hypothetical protein [Aquincola tertiaricarbonis]
MTARALNLSPAPASCQRLAALAAACLLGLATQMAPAQAQAQTAAGSAASRAEAERAACLNGTSHQDRATCLKEAGAAQDERRRGTLDDGQADRYQQNALQRCQGLPAAEQADCVKRANGLGQQSGSVKGGGLIKETVTRTVGTPPVAQAASAASSPASDPPAPAVR